MRLSGQKVKGLEFRHPLFQAGLKPITPERVAVILPSIRSGDKKACEEAILGHTLLALQIVGRYLRRLDSDQQADDLSGAALEGIVVAIDKVAHGSMSHDNLTGYVTETIHRMISDYLVHAKLIYVPRETIRDAKRQGRQLPKLLKRVTLEDAAEQKASDVMLESEVDEILSKLFNSDTERKIIECRREGMSDADIASFLGLSKTTVFLIRKEVESRFLELIR